MALNRTVTDGHRTGVIILEQPPISVRAAIGNPGLFELEKRRLKASGQPVYGKCCDKGVGRYCRLPVWKAADNQKIAIGNKRYLENVDTLY